MAKVGTAHIEIKPALNSEALETLCQRIEDAVAHAVRRGIERGAESKSAGTFTETNR